MQILAEPLRRDCVVALSFTEVYPCGVLSQPTQSEAANTRVARRHRRRRALLIEADDLLFHEIAKVLLPA